jgi:hypothetical protein
MIDTELKTNSISSEFTASEQRVVFRNISWSAYEQILSALGQILKSTLHLHSMYFVYLHAMDLRRVLLVILPFATCINFYYLPIP